MAHSTALTRDFDDLFGRFFGAGADRVLPTAGWEVPTDVYRTGDRLFIRMDVPGVDPKDVEVTSQENMLLINGKRYFPGNPDEVQFLRRGTFYGDFTQRVALGKGLAMDKISARYDNGVLELSIPYAEEVQPKKISIQVGDNAQQLTQ